MTILDENVPESQRLILLRKRLAVRQIGFDLRRQGMKDTEIIPLLHRLDRPTFFTRDGDFYKRRLCHGGYCLVYLDVDDDMAADYVRRCLRHRELSAKAKRMGRVLHVAPSGIAYWQMHKEAEGWLEWR